MTVSNQAKEIMDLVKKSNLSQEELRAINESVVEESRRLKREKTKTFSKGQRVRINSNGHSNGVTGTIEKVNQKTIIVMEDSGHTRWKTSPGLLEVLAG